MESQAAQVTDGNLSMSNTSEGLCEQLMRGFRDAVPPECSAITNLTDWGRVEARPLTGSQAPQPPSPAQNASTNCHPVIPSNYNLALTLNSSTNYPYSGPGRRALFGVGDQNNTVVGYFWGYQAVPILTLFRSNSSALGEASDEADGSATASISLSCLQAPPEMYGYNGPLTGGAGAVVHGGSWYGSLIWSVCAACIVHALV